MKNLEVSGDDALTYHGPDGFTPIIACQETVCRYKRVSRKYTQNTVPART